MKTPRINLQTVKALSKYKQEPEWMLDLRLEAFGMFKQMSLPQFGPNLSDLQLNEIVAFLPTAKQPAKQWSDIPVEIKNTFDRLGVPMHERKYLAGLTAQSESTAIYHQMGKYWEEQGIIFCDLDSAVQRHPELVKAYFGQIVSASDNYFAALNTAFWSGGSFLYVPPGKELALPVQSYFHFDTRRLGQFERTLIIMEPNSRAHYIEGCSAPLYTEASLHAAVVEVFLKPKSTFAYTTVQNWSKNVYNLVTKRARVEQAADLTWTDCNLGAAVTMKYPTALLTGKAASANLLSLNLASKGQNQDTGARAIHLAPQTSSIIRSYSLSLDGGASTFRGTVKATPQARAIQTKLICESLVLDQNSQANNYPVLDINAPNCRASQEASVSRVEEERISYLLARGLTHSEAISLLINGFFEPVISQIPAEYSLEINRLLEMIINS